MPGIYFKKATYIGILRALAIRKGLSVRDMEDINVPRRSAEVRDELTLDPNSRDNKADFHIYRVKKLDSIDEYVID